jgi:hypothetical protein
MVLGLLRVNPSSHLALLGISWHANPRTEAPEQQFSTFEKQ